VIAVLLEKVNLIIIDFTDYWPFQVWKHSVEVGFLDNGRLKDELKVFRVSSLRRVTSVI